MSTLSSACSARATAEHPGRDGGWHWCMGTEGCRMNGDNSTDKLGHNTAEQPHAASSPHDQPFLTFCSNQVKLWLPPSFRWVSPIFFPKLMNHCSASSLVDSKGQARLSFVAKPCTSSHRRRIG